MSNEVDETSKCPKEAITNGNSKIIQKLILDGREMSFIKKIVNPKIKEFVENIVRKYLGTGDLCAK